MTADKSPPLPDSVVGRIAAEMRELAEVSDDCRYGTISTGMAREWADRLAALTDGAEPVAGADEEALIVAIWQAEHPGKTSLFPLKYLAESEKDRYRRIIEAVRSHPTDDDSDDGNSDYSREHDRYAER
jgi:hypothetical protein